TGIIGEGDADAGAPPADARVCVARKRAGVKPCGLSRRAPAGRGHNDAVTTREAVTWRAGARIAGECSGSAAVTSATEARPAIPLTPPPEPKSDCNDGQGKNKPRGRRLPVRRRSCKRSAR